MTYELAKELKDAGFPLREKSPEDFAITCAGGKIVAEAIIIDGFRCFLPTLDELIEACGTWIDIYGFKDMWSATNKTAEANANIFYGSTASEAVARLWLALNKK